MVPFWSKRSFWSNDLIPNWILVFARPKWTKMVHFGLKRSSLVHLGPPTVLWPFLRAHPIFLCVDRQYLKILNPVHVPKRGLSLSGILSMSFCMLCVWTGQGTCNSKDPLPLPFPSPSFFLPLPFSSPFLFKERCMFDYTPIGNSCHINSKNIT